jgi:porphobilinogen synthase
MTFPEQRLRRLRKNSSIRRIVRETRLSLDNLIYPMFVVPGKGIKKEIPTMPGNFQLSLDILLKEAEEILNLKIPAVILFGIPEKKDPIGSEGYSKDGIVQKCVRALKETFPELIVITDVCLCEYTSHGHCGIIENNCVKNDETIELLSKMALSHAKAGADIVAPSDMMDGRVLAIRSELDKNGFDDVIILSYAAKYASSFYGPFREAADSAPQFGDRKSYQMDPANALEAMREVELDIEEGADIIMVKPALGYLDIIYRVKEFFDVPVAAYNVSGEFSMIEAASKNNWIHREKAIMETLTCIKRAGADMILTYFAKDAAKIIKSGDWY